MAQRYEVRGKELGGDEFYSDWVEVVKYEDYAELEAENARLRQQRDAANAQLDFILENLKEEKAP